MIASAVSLELHPNTALLARGVSEVSIPQAAMQSGICRRPQCRIHLCLDRADVVIVSPTKPRVQSNWSAQRLNPTSTIVTFLVTRLHLSRTDPAKFWRHPHFADRDFGLRSRGFHRPDLRLLSLTTKKHLFLDRWRANDEVPPLTRNALNCKERLRRKKL